MYYWKAYLWENGAKSVDYTAYLAEPIFLEDKLDESLDSGEIILESMPIATRHAFPPKTKFRLERYVSPDYSDTPRKWDMVVEHDDVEEYTGCPEICCHRIHLIETSAVAQGMHIDNIALTYELQDVSLNYKTVVSRTGTIGDKNALVVENNGYNTAIHANPPMRFGTVYFQNSYRYVWSGYDNINTLLYEQDARTPHTFDFTIPTLMAQGSFGSGWQNLFEMETKTQVIKRHFKGSTLLGEEVIFERLCGPTSLGADVKNDVYGINVDSYILNPGDPIPTYPKKAYAVRINTFTSRTEGLIISLNDLDTFSDHINVNIVQMSQENVDFGSKNASFTTDILSESQLEQGERYTYEIKCFATRNSLPSYYETACDVWETSGPAAYNNSTRGSYGTFQYVTGSSIYVSTTAHILDLSSDVTGADFLVKARKYNCYDLLRKALLTCDTQIFDNTEKGLENIQYPIAVDDTWANRLKAQTMYETVLEQKNLWEVLLQIGYYLHAIPYLEFAEDGTDRFLLRFRQLGDTRKKEDTSNKITVFNSRNLSEYFAQYDSYVTNLFSPQNVVDEWVVPKTSDTSYLVSNDTAELHVKYPIQEMLEFNLTYNNDTKPAIDYIFENSVYSILNPSTRVRPSKASALYYAIGNNKIEGLNYTPPSVNDDALYALKNIVSSVFGINASSVKFNDIKFHVKYRTQDSIRVSQLRPDLHTFMKNSAYEKYPHHEQFYGQQEKIVDSERFSANLWGRLIRVANDVYQRQEYVDSGNEKESGDLVTINNDVYYVTATENEYYNTSVFQKVTYSKNFNQLSNIVTIPSEPRFYEVSERSQVRREVMLMEFLMLSTTPNSETQQTRYLNANKWREFIRNLLFRENAPVLPNFAYTRFKADIKRQHRGSYGQVLPIEQMFPSVEVEVNPETNSVVPKPSSDHRDVIVPLLHFPLKNAVTFVWDMDDNFKAGDCIDVTINGKNDITDESYYSLQSVRYCDIMGRADLFSFKLFNKTDWTMLQTRRLPFAENTDFMPTEEQSLALLPNTLSIGLDKDNREALSFNYQVNLLQEDTTFVTFSNLFGEKSSRLKMCLLSKEVSLFDEAISITDATLIADNVTFDLTDSSTNSIELKIQTPSGIALDSVKSVVLYDEENGAKYAYIAKNVEKLPSEKKLQSWWIYPIFSSDVILAEPEPPQPPIQHTVTIRGSGQGNTSPFGAVPVNNGEEITITATPVNGSTFRWFSVSQVGEVLRLYSQNPFTITVESDLVITAIYEGGGILV